MPVKQAGIVLPDPTQTAGANWIASCMVTGHLVAALRGTAKFGLGNHSLLMREGRQEKRQRHPEEAETALVESQSAA